MAAIQWKEKEAVVKIRINHDKLFDRGYISFDDTGRILISEKLDDNNRMYMNITPTMKIVITEENIKYIKYHRKNVFIEK